MTQSERIIAEYRIVCSARDIEARARAIAHEQSVETPIEAIADAYVLGEIVGRVEDIADAGGGAYRVRISLAAATVGADAGQLLNMLFGNSSLHEDVTLLDASLPQSLIAAFAALRPGAAGLRGRLGAHGRALTATALKPQGLSVDDLAGLARRFALGGVDVIKDDHGLADQAYSPFAPRLRACAAAVRAASAQTGLPTLYAPSLSGDLDAMRSQLALAREEGVQAALVSPMLCGLPAFHALAREHPEVAFLAHPAMGGAARIAPPLLIGGMFRLFGASAVIFPNHGGRFGYSRETCAAIADAARAPWGPVPAAMPAPAGGMSLERVGEMLEFYGADTMLLIGGALLAAGDRLTEAAQAFAARARSHDGRSAA